MKVRVVGRGSTTVTGITLIYLVIEILLVLPPSIPVMVLITFKL